MTSQTQKGKLGNLMSNVKKNNKKKSLAQVEKRTPQKSYILKQFWPYLLQACAHQS